MLDSYDIRSVHDRFRAAYPIVDRQPPFGGYSMFPGQHNLTMSIPMGAEVAVFGMPIGTAGRFWFVSPSGTNLIQVQENFLARNWRRTDFDPDQVTDYPGYEVLKSDFVNQVEVLRELRGDSDFPAPSGCELLYDNFIPLLTKSGEPIKMSDVLTVLKPWGRHVVGMNMSWFEYMDKAEGSMTEPADFQVSVGHGAQITTAGEFYPYLRVMFVARSFLPTWEAVYGFFDKAHDYVTKRLTVLISPEAQARWNS
jgi:uncharacterized protein (TIGR04255 family)